MVLFGTDEKEEEIVVPPLVLFVEAMLDDGVGFEYASLRPK
jgi:hypothetical protein